MSRTATLLLMDGDGSPLGTTPPPRTGLPDWQEATGVVREAFGPSSAVRSHSWNLSALCRFAGTAGAAGLKQVNAAFESAGAAP